MAVTSQNSSSLLQIMAEHSDWWTLSSINGRTGVVYPVQPGFWVLHWAVHPVISPRFHPNRRLFLSINIVKFDCK